MNGKKARKLRKENREKQQYLKSILDNKQVPDFIPTKEKGMHLGYWNGEHKAWYKVVLVKILPVEDPKMHWQNAFVGTTRQAVFFHYDGQQCIIDNGTGTGLYKITIGLGSPQVGHASIGAHVYIKDVPESEWQYPDEERHERERIIIDDWQRHNFPEEYEQKLKLLESLKQFQSMTTDQKVAHIRDNMMKK